MATPTITRMVPVPRNQGIQVPGLWPVATWIDCLVLVGGAAQSYTLPHDAQTPNQRAMILRLTANAGPLFINFNGTAVVPIAKSDGTSPIMVRTDLGPMLLVAPDFASALSVICPSAAIVTIEAWS